MSDLISDRMSYRSSPIPSIKKNTLPICPQLEKKIEDPLEKTIIIGWRQHLIINSSIHSHNVESHNVESHNVEEEKLNR